MNASRSRSQEPEGSAREESSDRFDTRLRKVSMHSWVGIEEAMLNIVVQFPFLKRIDSAEERSSRTRALEDSGSVSPICIQDLTMLTVGSSSVMIAIRMRIKHRSIQVFGN